MARKFRSARTDMRKRPKSRVRRKVKSEKAKAVTKKAALDRYYKRVKDNGPKRPNAWKELTIATQCQCLYGGKKVWVKAKGKNGRPIIRNGKPVTYPAIILRDEFDGPKGRCHRPAIASKRLDGKTVYRCAEHLNIWYVDESGEAHRLTEV